MHAAKLFAVLVLLLGFSANVSAKVTAEQIAVVINIEDEDSRLIADYYRKKRGIPEENMIEINLPYDKSGISVEKFEAVFQQVKNQTPDGVQYYALAWSKPFKVGCMSIT